MYSTKEKILKDILRHEFAHYLTFIHHGSGVQAHGEEYRNICHHYSWGENVYKASANLEQLNSNLEGDLNAEKIIDKIKKLLKLASSENEHESQAATIKANELLLKYNLNLIESESFETLYVDKLIIQKRKSAKLIAIYDMIKHFMVTPILSYGKGQVALEATGTKANIELAHYVAGFLDQELERLWDIYKKENNLTGTKAKNSFFLGLAKGYDLKNQQMMKNFSPVQSQNLVMIKNKLDSQVKKIYHRLSSSASGNSLDQTSFNAGKSAGQSLSINRGLNNNNSISRLIGWKK